MRPVKDTTAYVVKVTVAEDAANTRNLTATGTVLGYADDINSPLNPLTLPEGELPAFYNTDTYDLISAASYSVYAASGEPVDQVCYVDPKIVQEPRGPRHQVWRVRLQAHSGGELQRHRGRAHLRHY